MDTYKDTHMFELFWLKLIKLKSVIYYVFILFCFSGFQRKIIDDNRHFSVTHWCCYNRSCCNQSLVYGSKVSLTENMSLSTKHIIINTGEIFREYFLLILRLFITDNTSLCDMLIYHTEETFLKYVLVILKHSLLKAMFHCYWK